MIKKDTVVHPFLFALYPVLSLYAYNIDRTPFYVILVPALLALTLTLILLFLSKRVVRDSAKAGIVTTIMLVFFFSYGHIFYSFLIQLHIGGLHIGRERYMFPAYIVFSASAIYAALLIMKKRQISGGTTQFLNMMAAILVLLCAVNIIKPLNTSSRGNDRNLPGSEEKMAAPESLRDIYYIVPDMYASASTLREVYGYDNSVFTEFLESRGFYIADKSRSNYPITDLSLASSLNMEYLDYLREVVGEKKEDRAVLLNKVKDNNVRRLLKSYGYRYIQFCSGYGVTEKNPYADMNYCSYGFFSEYLKVLIDTTIFSSFYGNYIEPNIIRNRVGYVYEELPRVPYIEGPKFTLVHLPVPHYPYVFGPNGEKLSPLIKTNDKGRYLDQLIYVSRTLPPIIDQILSRSKLQPIIVIQADHGPDNTGTLVSPTDDFLKERLNILNAYYLPGKAKNPLYKSISPVNSFRLIFNLYFNTDFKLLKDTSYVSKYEDLYNFRDISSEKLEY